MQEELGLGSLGSWGVVRENVSVREHIVRDTRQQMERRGSGEADSSDTPKREGG